jgi:hypothetical protein
VLEDIGAVNQDSLSCTGLRSPLAGSPGRPLLDRFLSPELGSSDVRVGLGHLVACDVCADGDFCDAEELGNLFCRPPVSAQRTGGLSHAADGTAMRCLKSYCFCILTGQQIVAHVRPKSEGNKKLQITKCPSSASNTTGAYTHLERKWRPVNQRAELASG